MWIHLEIPHITAENRAEHRCSAPFCRTTTNLRPSSTSRSILVVLRLVESSALDRFTNQKREHRFRMAAALFYTPTSIIRLFTEVIKPYRGRILDPACGSGGMFVSSARFVSEHKKSPAADLSIHDVEKTDETGRLCRHEPRRPRPRVTRRLVRRCVGLRRRRQAVCDRPGPCGSRRRCTMVSVRVQEF